MNTEVRIGDKQSEIEIISQTGDEYHVKIGGKEYHINAVKMAQNNYSVLHKGRSINMTMVEGSKPGSYTASTLNEDFDIEIIDPVIKYRSRTKTGLELNENIIKAPMPGKVVKILVAEGSSIIKGETVIVVSAMKMESEYKAPFNGTVKSIHVTEGQTVDANASLIELTAQEQ